jgi:replicative DNA helicase
MTAHEWPDRPTPPIAHKPDKLPVQVFPDVLKEHIKSVAGAIEVPADLPALLSIVACSAAVAGKVEAFINNKWPKVWCAFYGIGILDSGERKSTTFSAMMDPIFGWLHDEQQRLMPDYLKAQDRVDALQLSLDREKRKGPPDMSMIEQARKDLTEAKAAVPYSPDWWRDDVTHESLVSVMAENEGRAAILSPEGGPFRNLDGKYSDGVANTEAYKKGFDGEKISIGRQGREDQLVDRAALTLGVCLQPSVLETLRNQRTLRGEGVLARCAYVYPESRAGYRNHRKAPALNKEAEASYRSMVRDLCDFDGCRTSDGALVPIQIAFTKEALELLYDFMDEYELEKLPGGRLRPILSWGEKAHGLVVRVAVLFALADRIAKKADRPLADIEKEWVAAGIAVVRALSTHALFTFGQMDADGDQKILRYVLDRALELEANSTLRDLHRLTQRKAPIKSDGMEKLRELVEELQELGCLRLEQREPGQSPYVRVNPAVRVDNVDRTPEPGTPVNNVNMNGDSSDTVPDFYGPLQEVAHAHR